MSQGLAAGVPPAEAASGALGEVIFGADDIAAAVERIAQRLRADYEGREIVLVGILKGAFAFTADLMRALKEHAVMVDFMVLSSYGTGRRGHGDVRLLKDLELDPAGRNIVLVEDIVDEGLTLAYLLNNMRSREPLSLKSCTLLDKPFHRRVNVHADYIGLVAPDAFLVGYGLDYQERHRNLPYICKLRDLSIRTT